MTKYIFVKKYKNEIQYERIYILNHACCFDLFENMQILIGQFLLPETNKYKGCFVSKLLGKRSLTPNLRYITFL